MVRTIALCALFFAVHSAAAQAVTPRIIANPANEPEPAVGITDTASTDAPDEHELAPSTTETATAKPVDKHALLRQKLAEMNCLQSEIDELRVATGTPQAIQLKMCVLEVSRTNVQKRGGNFDELIATGCLSDEQLRWLRDTNVAKVLSEPRMAVVCGRPAQLSVGGEVPVPAAAGSKQPVEFQKIGTQIDLVAHARGENRLRLELRARVSDIDTARSNSIDGNSVPAFTVRQIDSAVETQIGQTVAISGITQPHIDASGFENKTANGPHDIELVFLVKTEPYTGNVDTGDTQTYRTATSASEERPNERSLRVTKPFTPR